MGGFIGDLKEAKALIHDAAGIRLKATHAFAIGDLCDYVAAYADAQGRPVFSPTFDDNQLPLRAAGDPAAKGFTGYWVSGLALFENLNIPNLSTADYAQTIVCRPSTILQIEGAVTPYLYPQSAANTLDAILGLRCYVGTISRFRGGGVAVISGGAYKASNFS